MTLRAIFFDMGGTIETFGFTRQLRLDATPGVRRLLRAAGIDLDLSDAALLDLITDGLQRYKEFCLASRVELPQGRVWSEYILPGYTFDPARLDAVAEELMLYLETHYYRREMRPDVPEVLEAIRQMGLKIGLISNVNSRGQVALNLAQYGIRSYFDPIVLSSEYGLRKPDPSIFHYAARMMNVPTSACAYIGDRIARDIIGAQKAGFRLAIQIQHDFDHGEEDAGATPDAVISEMGELIGILRAELARPAPEPAGLIRALLFDAGDILYYRPQRGQLFAAFLKSLGLDRSAVPTAQVKRLTRQAAAGQMPLAEFENAYLRLFGVHEPQDLEEGKRVLAEDQGRVEFFAGVRETLLALKEQGYLLGIITDTFNSLHTKLSWFERGGFCQVWDSIISSYEMGVCKPEPAIYHAALCQLGLSAGQTAFVGHNLAELAGARALGMKTIAFNSDAGAQADYFIASFGELLQVPIVAGSVNPNY
jgi:HAD superfamily hydrolase (TIGR01549 family)/HAD superfamily hydrolase (TIGR01509 family)